MAPAGDGRGSHAIVRGDQPLAMTSIATTGPGSASITSTGMLLRTPPSTRTRPSRTTGGVRPGMHMLIPTASHAGPRAVDDALGLDQVAGHVKQGRTISSRWSAAQQALEHPLAAGGPEQRRPGDGLVVERVAFDELPPARRRSISLGRDTGRKHGGHQRPHAAPAGPVDLEPGVEQHLEGADVGQPRAPPRRAPPRSSAR